MEWVKNDKDQNIPIKSWCVDVEPGALDQALDLSRHPVIIKHVALMPDCHQGYGMPIGGVIACDNAVIPNAVGVDIGCGMGAVKTSATTDQFTEKSFIRALLNAVKERTPAGEGHAHKTRQEWSGFSTYLEELNISSPLEDYKQEKLPGWLDEKSWALAQKNLGTLGGGNHFIELQKSTEDDIWMMLHSGSRNLGYRIADFYNKAAVQLNTQWKTAIPNSNLAFLPAESELGKAYIRDMNFALSYALKNREIMMKVFKEEIAAIIPDIEFTEEINIHHNYAAREDHFGQKVWVHRKGATSAKLNEMGIIPGSMGTSSYIVRGKGNPDSFMSCSHGAGRIMSRTAACDKLTIEQCDEAMEGIVHDRWNKRQRWKKKNGSIWDLSESPQAYKDIDKVIKAEADLIEPVVKLSPLGVIKG